MDTELVGSWHDNVVTVLMLYKDIVIFITLCHIVICIFRNVYSLLLVRVLHRVTVPVFFYFSLSMIVIVIGSVNVNVNHR